MKAETKKELCEKERVAMMIKASSLNADIDELLEVFHKHRVFRLTLQGLKAELEKLRMHMLNLSDYFDEVMK